MANPNAADETRRGRLTRAAIAVFVFAIVLAMSAQTRNATEPIKLLVLQAGALILVALVCLTRLNERRPFDRPGALCYIFAGFVALNLLSAALSDYPRYSLDDARRLLAMLVLLFVAAQVYTRRDHAIPLLVSVGLAVGLSSVYALFQKAGLDPFPWADRTLHTYRQLPGTLGNPNVAGHAIVMALVACATLLFEPRRRWAAIPLPIIALHFAFTGHRAGILAVAAAALAAIVVWLFARRPALSGQTKTVGLAAAFVVVGVAAVLAATGLVSARATHLVPQDASTVVRLNTYYNAAQMIQDQPVIGYGPGAYIVESPRYWTDFEADWFESTRVMNRRVHNEFLESAVSAGLLGAAFYVAFFVVAIVQSLALAFGATTPGVRRLGICFAALFVGFSVDSAFGFNFNSPASGALVALAAGVLSGLSRNPAAAPLPRTASIAIGAIAILLCIASTLAETRRYRGEMRFHTGAALREAGQHARAEAELAKAETLTPWNWRYPRERGVVQYEIGAYAAAIPHFQRSLDANPNWITTLIPAANAALNQATTAASIPTTERERLLADAVAYAERALELNPYSALAAEALGRARYTQAALASQQPGADATAAWAVARDALERAIANGPESPGVLLAMLGQAQSRTGDPDSAAETLARALRAEPGQQTHWTTAYNFAREHNRFHVLERLAVEALESRPKGLDRGRAYLWLAIAREQGGRPAEAVIQAYRSALNASADDPEIWGQFGLYAATANQVEPYRNAYTQLSKRKRAPKPPATAGLRALDAVWTSEPPRYADAIATLENEVERQPEANQTATARSIRWAAMILALEIGQPQNETQAHALFRTGRFLRRANEPQRARAAFEHAAPLLQGEPKAEALRHAAETALQLGDTAAARTHIDQAIATDPDNPAVTIAEAKVLIAENRPDAATQRLQQTLRNPRLTNPQRTTAQHLLTTLQSR